MVEREFDIKMCNSDCEWRTDDLKSPEACEFSHTYVCKARVRER